MQRREELDERQRVEKMNYEKACQKGTIEAYNEYLKMYSHGKYVKEILTLKQQYVRYQLLKNYKVNVRETVELLSDIYQEAQNPFTKGDHSNELISKITQSRVYAKYKEYDDWINTYLGYMLKEVIGYL